MSISSENDTDSTESDGKYDSENQPDVDMRLEDDVDAPDGVHLDGDVDMDWDGDNEAEQDEEEQDEEEEDEDEEDEEQEQDENGNENDGKEPRTISQEVIVNTSADDVDTTVDVKPIVLPGQG